MSLFSTIVKMLKAQILRTYITWLRDITATTDHLVDSIMFRYVIDYISILNSVCSDQIGILQLES
jgi:hypothetical protein